MTEKKSDINSINDLSTDTKRAICKEFTDGEKKYKSLASYFDIPAQIIKQVLVDWVDEESVMLHLASKDYVGTVRSLRNAKKFSMYDIYNDLTGDHYTNSAMEKDIPRIRCWGIGSIRAFIIRAYQWHDALKEAPKAKSNVFTADENQIVRYAYFDGQRYIRVDSIPYVRTYMEIKNVIEWMYHPIQPKTTGGD